MLLASITYEDGMRAIGYAMLVRRVAAKTAQLDGLKHFI